MGREEETSPLGPETMGRERRGRSGCSRHSRATELLCPGKQQVPKQRVGVT